MPQLCLETFVTQYLWLLIILFSFFILSSLFVIPKISFIKKTRFLLQSFEHSSLSSLPQKSAKFLNNHKCL